MYKKVLLGLLLLLLLYTFFFPINLPIEIWTPMDHPGYEGIYEPNNFLEEIESAGDNCYRCEDVHTWNGHIVGGQETGELVGFRSNGSRIIMANTDGRPLGLDVDSSSNLIVADAKKGLLSLDTTGQLSLLSTESEGIPFKFTDDVEVAPNGMIYFSDASSEFGFGYSSLEAFIHGTNGRLLEYNPTTKQTRTLMDDLAFANGIAVSPDGSFVLVNETFEYRVNKYWLTGPNAGSSEVLIENLPGFPDGISRGEDGIFWLAMIGQRIPSMDGLLTGTFIRKILLRFDFLRPKESRHYNMVLGIDASGDIIYNFQDPNAIFKEITSVHQEGNTLFFGTLKDTYIGKIDFKE